MTRRTPNRTLAVALAISLALASGRAAPDDTRETQAGAQPSLLRVGPERELKRPSAAAQIARDGDVIEIDAGVYDGDAAGWRPHRPVIRGVGGPAHLRSRRGA